MSGVDTIHLWHGIQRTSEHARFAVRDIHRATDGTARVDLRSTTTQTRCHTLRVGDTFPVGAETWRLAELTGWPSEEDWLVVLRRVAAEPPA